MFAPSRGSFTWLLLDVEYGALAACDSPCALRVCCDIGDVPSLLSGGIAEVVTANPPFLDSGRVRRPPDRTRGLARVSPPFARALFTRAAAHLLRKGGEFRIVNRPSALEEMLVCCRAFGLEPLELQPYGPPGCPASLVRLRALRGAGRAFSLLPQAALPPGRSAVPGSE